MIYLVTGHPRSGTSMLMQACEAGGLPVAKSKERDAFNRANSDEHYKPNPNGLYELAHHGYHSEAYLNDWDVTAFNGYAVKVVCTNLNALPKPRFTTKGTETRYSAVIMLRDPEEIRQSFEASFGIETTVERIADWQRWTREILKRRGDVVAIKKLWYPDVIANPVASIRSLGWPIDVKEAAAVVDPALYRFRSPVLVEGI